VPTVDVIERVRARAPELFAASQEVDVSLIRETLKLTVRERLERATALAKRLGGLQRARRRS
jgi:hypothetical protein